MWIWRGEGLQKDAFLLRWLDNEPRLSLALHQHLGLLAGTPSADSGARRTVEELLKTVGSL